MEHSFFRDSNRVEISNGLQPARMILVRRPPQCPLCHTQPSEEEEDINDRNQAAIPFYNEKSTNETMNESERVAKFVENNNADNEDWEMKIEQIGWSTKQKSLFAKVARLLDNDQLSRLANCSRPDEAMQRRAIVDKSAVRMRRALASVAWETSLTQWLHSLLMNYLPASYMASYIDILQTLKSKLPTLMGKMLFGRPLNVNQEILMGPVVKKKWEPQIDVKSRELLHNAVILALPSMPMGGPVPNRLQKWYQHLATITQIVQVTLPNTGGYISRQPWEQVAEEIVSLTRVKINELRSEDPQRNIILIGFNAGASMALQVGRSEKVACIVCMGFAYNTYNGVRGTSDDQILYIKVPILFVIGQNSEKSSPEEIECLRENMRSQSSLVIVGSADDSLRVPTSKRKIENVTQSMVDTMVVDEIYDFIKNTLANPPGHRRPTKVNRDICKKLNKLASSEEYDCSGGQHKRKQEDSEDTTTVTKDLGDIKSKQDTKVVKKPKIQDPLQPKRKVGRPRTRPLPNTTKECKRLTGKHSQIYTSKPVLKGKASSMTGIMTIPRASPNNKLTTSRLPPISDIFTSTSVLKDRAHSMNRMMTTTGALAIGKQTSNRLPLMSEIHNPDATVITSIDYKSQNFESNCHTFPQCEEMVKMIPRNFPPNLGGSSAAVVTNMTIITSNQFEPYKPNLMPPSSATVGTNFNLCLPLKPVILPSPSKSCTLKPRPLLDQTHNDRLGVPQIGSMVTTIPSTATAQHCLSFDTPNGQFATALDNIPTFTIIKKSTAPQKPLLPITSTTTASSLTTNNLHVSNIMDMPVIFADNGCIISEDIDTYQTSNLDIASSGIDHQHLTGQPIEKKTNSPTIITCSKSGCNYLSL
uniref:KANSL3 helical domain-containing protein n=1 Tax=Stomoxys calcitrans TaxID=35570 RepID=A0A1I8NVU0_STOCA